MSNPGAGRTRSPGRKNSKRLAIEVHLLACGHGDTILIKLPAKRWVLVDCHLPKHDGTHDRFFEFVRSRRIKRLDYIFQTHPHYDHFLGMTDVLEYFTRDGRSVGYWCDGGIDAQRLRDLNWAEAPSETHYGKLRASLDRLDENNQLVFRELDDQQSPLSPKGFAGRVALVPIAPLAAKKRSSALFQAESGAQSDGARLATNALSLVLVLTVKENRKCCNVLLAADAEKGDLEVALQSWREYAEQNGRPAGFDAVKVPHHGSIDAHPPGFCTAPGNTETRVAAISAGTRRGLPDERAIIDYLNENWLVLLTTTRRQRSVCARPMDIVNRRKPISPQFRLAQHQDHLDSRRWFIVGAQEV